jgi:hypothetical protein
MSRTLEILGDIRYSLEKSSGSASDKS